MPIYEYCCARGHMTEQFVPTPKQSIKCPECGAKAPRVFSAPAIHFKGKGFYNTDYRKPAILSAQDKNQSHNEAVNESRKES
jgi:putative FmdB family regulatory protein